MLKFFIFDLCCYYIRDDNTISNKILNILPKWFNANVLIEKRNLELKTKVRTYLNSLNFLLSWLYDTNEQSNCLFNKDDRTYLGGFFCIFYYIKNNLLLISNHYKHSILHKIIISNIL